MRDSRHYYHLMSDLRVEPSFTVLIDDASHIKMYPHLSKFLDGLNACPLKQTIQTQLS